MPPEPLRSAHLSLLTMASPTVDRLPTVSQMTQQLSARPPPALAGYGTPLHQAGPVRPLSSWIPYLSDPLESGNHAEQEDRHRESQGSEWCPAKKVLGSC